MLTAVLGSCVAACIYDPQARIGGMNHILLPDHAHAGGEAARNTQGVHLMELLINALMRSGAARDRLVAKLFGGARVLAGVSDIGARNARFAEHFLDYEGIPIAVRELGGSRGRRIQFWPATGRVRRAMLRDRSLLSEPPVVPSPPCAPAGDVELFEPVGASS
ncbi:MAG TPA: chemotaxis protein CheD [Acidisphaera sp.]|nr:chemotaxis protein CheD [Acidisphaera sp.]